MTAKAIAAILTALAILFTVWSLLCLRSKTFVWPEVVDVQYERQYLLGNDVVGTVPPSYETTLATPATLATPLKLPSRLPKVPSPLSQKIIANVEKFVLFIGWPRSGHTILTRMLDAHSNVLIGRFEDAQLGNVSENMTKAAIFNHLYEISHKHAVNPSGLPSKFTVGGLWQGRFEELKQIGLSNNLVGVCMPHSKSSYDCKKFCHQLSDTVNIPIRVIEVVRNPYDMIATGVLYQAEVLLSGRYSVKIEASPTNKYDDPELMKRHTQQTFAKAETLGKMVDICNMTVLEIHHADHVKYPVETLQKICDFLELECSPYYLEKCSSETAGLSRTRDSVVWPPDILAMVEEEIQKYPFFQRYSFDKDY